MLPMFSIIIPTRNNATIIERCLQSIKDLDYPQDRIEIIIADGLSSDNTANISNTYGATVYLDFVNSVCAARNLGFSKSNGEYVAFTDSDCVVDKKWLKNALKYFRDEKVGGIGGANLIPADETPFGKAVGLLFAFAPYFVKAAHTRIIKKVIRSRSHGSNSIYRAEVLRKVFPIDERMKGGEDVIMTDKIEDLGYDLLYVPDVVVSHYRRPNITRWWKQMKAYGMGRALLPRKRKGEVKPLHQIVGFAIPILIALVAILIILNPIYVWAFVDVIFVVAFILAQVTAYYAKSEKVGLCMPLVVGIFILAWSYGYLEELIRGER